IRSGSASSTGWVARSRSRASASRRATCTGACSPWTSGSRTWARAPRRSPRRSDMSQQLARANLGDIQRHVADDLERVADELRRIITAAFPLIAEVNEHLLRMKGKLFRPTLLLLASRATRADA